MQISTIRNILLTVVLGLASSSIAAKEWAFDVFLDKSKMGQHTFTLNDNKLTSTAKFNVKVLFIEAYAYNHKATEQWNNGCLTQLTAHTVENKDVNDVNGKLTDAGFVVDNGKGLQTLPDCTMTFAYWDPKILTQTKLLNPQNAEWLDIKVNKIGEASIAVKGQQTNTTHYKLSGTLAGKQKLNIELWYTADTKEWVALKSTTPEGYLVSYVLK